MAIPADTTAEFEQAQVQLLRKKTPAERFKLAARLSSDVLRATKRAIARRYPEWSARQVEYLFIEMHYSRELAEAVRRRDGTLGNGGLQ